MVSVAMFLTVTLTLLRGLQKQSALALQILGFLLYPRKFQTEQSLTPRNSNHHRIVLQPSAILRPKTEALENPHDFFLMITPENSTLLLFNPWKFH